MTKRIVDMQFIKISKDIENAWFVKNSCFFRIAVHLLIHANWADNCKVKRGELLFSYRSVSKNTGVSLSSVNRFMKEAKKRGDVTLRKHNNGSILTLNFYDQGVFSQDTECVLTEHTVCSQRTQSVSSQNTIHRIEKNIRSSDPSGSHQLDLFGNTTKQKKTTPRKSPRKKKSQPKKPPSEPKQPNEVYELKKHWEARWTWHCRATWGEFTFLKREWGMMKNFLKEHGAEKCKYYMEEYLSNDDPSLAAKGYPLGILLVEAERIEQRDQAMREKKKRDWDLLLKGTTNGIPNSRRYAGMTPAA